MSDLFDMDIDTGMENLVDNTSNESDGIYRPSLKNAKDKKKGYRAVLRLLPNLTKEGVLGPNFIKKIVHYVKLPNHQELQGYYDSPKSFGKNENCLLTTLYWKLKNSDSVADQEKAEDCLNLSNKFYTYVQVIEDENNPELVGKILVYPMPKKIKDKIFQEKTGEITGEECNVYHPAMGKDFVLLIKEVGGYTNYDSSSFKGEKTPIKMFKDGKFGSFPTVEKGDGTLTIDPKASKKLAEMLMEREGELDDYAPQRYTDEIINKINKITEVLTNNAPTGGSTVTESEDSFFEKEPETAGAKGSEEDDLFSFDD